MSTFKIHPKACTVFCRAIQYTNKNKRAWWPDLSDSHIDLKYLSSINGSRQHCHSLLLLWKGSRSNLLCHQDLSSIEILLYLSSLCHKKLQSIAPTGIIYFSNLRKMQKMVTMQPMAYHGVEGGHHDRRPNHQSSEWQDVVPTRMPMDPLVLAELTYQSPPSVSVLILDDLIVRETGKRLTRTEWIQCFEFQN